MNPAEIFAPLAMFACAFGICYIIFTTRHRERMALIEKGADPKLFNTKNPNRSHGTLKFGMLLVGVALGILMGSMMHAFLPEMREETANFAMIFLFGGLALIANYMIEARRKNDMNRK